MINESLDKEDPDAEKLREVYGSKLKLLEEEDYQDETLKPIFR
jgi:hypothetical protein